MNNDFNLDDYKVDFQHSIQSNKSAGHIAQMLNKNSIDNAKYVLIISIVEFLLLLVLFVLDLLTMNAQEANPTTQIPSENLESIDHIATLYRWLFGISLIISLVFIFTFYRLYKKLTLDATLKKFTNDIILFRQTANYFIGYNVGVFILFWFSITLFLVSQAKQIALSYGKVVQPNIEVMMYAASFVLFLILLSLLLVYYRYFWGMFLRRLRRNQKELQDIDTSDS